jgi:hypothetical protein
MPQNAYINLVEEDLVALIKRIKDTAYKIGTEVGILSYNETPLKEQPTSDGWGNGL